MVSCIIPVHNRKELLVRAMHSASDQHIDDIQIIVVDDGSTEDIEKAVSVFQKKAGVKTDYHRIPKSGANAARSFGQRFVTKPFVQFLDSDDVLMPDKWQKQLAHLRANIDIDVSVSGTYKDSQNGCQLSDPGYPAAEITATSFIFGRTRFKTSASLWRKDSLQRVVRWPSWLESSQDWETHFRALLFGMVFRYCTDSGFVIGTSAPDRIAHKPIGEKNKNKIMAMRCAIDAAKNTRFLQKKIVWPALMIGFRYLIACFRHSSASEMRPCLLEYTKLMNTCFRLVIS